MLFAMTERFEAAADAIVSGDLDTLARLLREDPELVRARRDVEPHPLLLHYVAANGVENERQQTPPNAVEILKLLLAAGAEVDGESYAYSGRGTTLGLVASSVHPERAGLEVALIDALLEAGANIEGLQGGWTPIDAALANHRKRAAEALAGRGARIGSLETAAGLGRLELVRQFAETSSPDQMAQAFITACRFGRTETACWFLDRGVDIAAVDDCGETGLHWAAGTGDLETVKLLLARGAPLEVKNTFGGTVLDSTIWFAHNGGFTGVDYAVILGALLEAGARTDVYPGMTENVEALLRGAR